jgi:hypothetical protein
VFQERAARAEDRCRGSVSRRFDRDAPVTCDTTEQTKRLCMCVEGTARQPFVLPSSRDHRFDLLSKRIAHVLQSNKLLEESEDFLLSLKKTAAERFRADSPHERVSGAPKPSLAEKQSTGKTSSAGAGRRSTADLYLRLTFSF